MANASEEKLNAAAGRPAGLACDLADVVLSIKSLFDPYRPELHYMRGPGPKWRAKYAPARTADILVDMSARPVLVRAKAR